MRIRKNKKLTASIIWSTAASSSSPNPPEELLQAHVCVVNRSPWDSPPSPPPLPPPLHPLDYPNHQAIETDNDSYGLNCDDSVPADKSSDSMKISSKSTTIIIPHSSNESGDAAMEVSHPPPKRKPGRPRKVPVEQPVTPPVIQRNVPPSNPEFYYYSGFGPRWGKRRGGDDGDDKIQQKNIYTAEQKNKRNNSKDNNNNASGRSCSSSSCSPCLIEETDDELDFLDDDEDDGGRKRMRKPVKARSLKSLIM